MLTVAYLANEFPSAVEPYVGEEIAELQRRGVRVVTGSVRGRKTKSRPQDQGGPDIVVQLAHPGIAAQAVALCLSKWQRLAPLIGRILFCGREGPLQRLKALAHTFVGACYAVLLEERNVDHIHVHHGYFGSWIAMTAARLLGVEFSMTLHGSDLLVHKSYLDVKLKYCGFCLTVSDYNRQYILNHYPDVAGEKVRVARLGVEVADSLAPLQREKRAHPFTLLAVGRLHKVKDHEFLVQACSQMSARDISFQCLIAGEGPERRRLESLIHADGLDALVTLLGHVPRAEMGSLYELADIVVLTSRSEGMPLVLMEAMARGKVVLAPAITGIPELVVMGHTGFLYEAGSMDDFIDRLLFIHSLMRAEGKPDQQHHPYVLSASKQLAWIRHAARLQVHHNFNRKKNLESFADLFLERIAPKTESIPDENFVLQQI